MRLYLASYAKDTIKTIIQHDGINPNGKTAVFIPTAGDPYDDKVFVEADRKALADVGFKVVDLDLKQAGKNSNYKSILLDADAILIAGGNTFYLMDWLIKTGFDKLLKRYIVDGGLYIGSSASSIICCPTIEGAVEFDDPKLAPDLKNYTGLDVFPNIVLPHAHKEQYFDRINRTTKKLEQDGFTVFHLTDDDVLFYDGKNTEILKNQQP